jgi:simple sugar transport system substrate-binding protein
LAEGKAAMEAILKSKGNEIQAVYAHNDDMALGAIQAIEEAGKKPGKDILVVSIDGVKGAFEAIIEGKLNCSIECNPLLGPNAFDAVKKAVTGEKLPKKSIVEDELFDQSNAKNLIGGRKY